MKDKILSGVERIIREQQKKKSLLPGIFYFPVELWLSNGNIMLKCFHVVALEQGIIKGITKTEDYSAPRENRAPVYCFFSPEEIAGLRCQELGIEVRSSVSEW
jgi:hypothetical protein